MVSEKTNSSFEDLSVCKFGVFWLEPYLQLGESNNSTILEVAWFTPLAEKHWRVEWRASGSTEWQAVPVKRVAKLRLPGIAVHVKQMVAVLNVGAQPRDAQLEYRLLMHGFQVFASHFKAPSGRVVVFGDFADDSEGPADTARAVLEVDPSLLVLAGDIAYENGRMVEYFRNLFPALNASVPADTTSGAALLRSRASAAAAGNHDVKVVSKDGGVKLGGFDDRFAYFRVFRHPRNGPGVSYKAMSGHLGEDASAKKNKRRGKALRKAFGDDFLSRSNFSFDWENQHWTILDGNPYVDWSDAGLRQWLRHDLQQASESKADWKFVVFHNPAFNNDFKYWCEQHMRLIFDILDEEGVDLVFCGHCHYYERHKPLRFRPSVVRPAADGTVDGALIVDDKFDGVTNTVPDGVICVITGAGGRTVSEEAKRSAGDRTVTTAKLVDDKRSFTVLDVDGKVLTLRQLGSDLSELDKIVVRKTA